jgi:hypothetical protein
VREGREEGRKEGKEEGKEKGEYSSPKSPKGDLKEIIPDVAHPSTFSGCLVTTKLQ